MRRSGWTVFIAYAFADRLFTYKRNGTEFQTWKQVWIADEQQNRIPHLQVPIEILQPVLIQRFREVAYAAVATEAAEAAMCKCCEQVHATTSPNIVDAIAAADLPSMNSGNSDDSIGEHHNKAH